MKIFYFLFFGLQLNLIRKIVSALGEDLFFVFGLELILDPKIVPLLVENFFLSLEPLQHLPPIADFWLRACAELWDTYSTNNHILRKKLACFIATTIFSLLI